MTHPGSQPPERDRDDLGEWGHAPSVTDDDWGHEEHEPAGEWTPGSPGGRGGGGGRPRHARAGVRRPQHPVLVGLAISVIVIVIAAGLVLLWAYRQIDPGGKPGAAVHVTIPTGASTSKIGSILSQKGVIHNSTLFDIYVKFKGSGTLEAGTYTFHKNEKYDDIISSLEQGPPVVLRRLVIPEGFTLEQIAARVGTLPGHSAKHFLAVATGGEVRSPYEPAGSNDLEGLVYPATYNVSPGEDDATILQQMVQTFDNVADNLGLKAAAAKLQLTPYQVITVASMVEREAKLNADRGPIASVIYNRLHDNMPLGVDSTLLYGLHQTDPNKVDFNTPNPYNTRLNTGLPPTPISNPGTPSLEAALHPPTTSYLYYVVVDSNGKTAFATTAAQFAQLRAICVAKGLC